MRRLALLLGLALNLAAQAPLPPEIEDPACLGIHKEPAHATLMPYLGPEEALAGRRRASSWALDLDGTWKFHWAPRPEARPLDFYREDFDDAGWASVPVPSNWQVLGYGTPHYRNYGYLFQPDYPKVMGEPPVGYTAREARNPVGSYRRDFTLPAAWAGREVFLTFDGVDSAFFLWVNGRKVGYSVNSRNAAEFDVTAFLRPGLNRVAVEVYRFSAGSYLEDQDMWRLSGIFRNVTLWSAPKVHVRDFRVETRLDRDYRDATLEVAATVHNYLDRPAPARSLALQLRDPGGRALPGAAVAVPALDPGAECQVRASVPVKAPAKWTAETPALHTVLLALEGDDFREWLSVRAGFRAVEVRGRQLLVNGTPLKLKGVNRHEHWPDTGHAVSEERMIEDLKLLKQGNCNHVRTCHYSDDPRWYELCDAWGIWLTAEANVESHGLYDVLDREPRARAAIVDRNVANVESFKNHPSVLMWSLGNECGGGDNFRAALEAVKARDGSRPVHYEPFGAGKDNPADVDSAMYTRLADVERIAKDPTLTRPFYLCEYAHAMFNSMGSVADYNDLFDRYPALLGGAIWEWEDQGLWNRRDPKRPLLAFGGGFGEVPNDHYFIHKGVVASDRSPKPHYPEMKRAYQWIRVTGPDWERGAVRVRNAYQFQDLDGFEGRWTLCADDREVGSGAFAVPGLAPGQERELRLPLAGALAKVPPGAETFLRIAFLQARDVPWAPRGFEQAAVQFSREPLVPARLEPGPGPLDLREAAGEVTVRGRDFAFRFSRATGLLEGMEKGGAQLLRPGGGPRPQLWRAPHQRDDMWAYEAWAKHGITDLAWKPEALAARRLPDGRVQVEAVLAAEGKLGFSVRHRATYTVSGDGTLVVDNLLEPAGPRVPLARYGVRMLLDRGLDRFAFFGRGPLETYADRKRGSDVGLWGGPVAGQLTPYEKPMECGNHEDLRWARLTGAGLPGLWVGGDGRHFQASALPYTDEQLAPVEYRIDLPEPSATVLTVASQTLGAGSAGCGPRPLDRYIPWSEPTSFRYVLRLLER